jgi:predicted secreted protein with PEFG-CTERM motif
VYTVKILVLALVLVMVTMIPYKITAFGEISTLVPPENTIQVNGTNFTILYSITGGKITSIQADTDAKTIDVSVQSSNNGTLTITLPTTLIDAYQGSNETHFMVLSNNHGIHYTELENFITTENRTLTIPLSLGTSMIEIKGTYMAPEFGSMVSIILVITFISIIVASKNRSKS